ncbi:hypothetical protein WG68_04420 [Arsukibacterium ikkense]|uniref:Helix-turn-helix domain-containing protein n=1 Tax=Arsukibacterium ikkense TaxID=336831 RepID=A0A0M2V6T9_9GAMM|nr:hypothetical protein WG68_04420 [Arsukibacterium ikkense]
MATLPTESADQVWLTSKEAKKVLKVSDCHLMHLRLEGKLQFRKEGNRYFYLIALNTHSDKELT